jgi:hypothetical protein
MSAVDEDAERSAQFFTEPTESEAKIIELEERIEALLSVMHRAELWLSTIPGSLKIRNVIRREAGVEEISDDGSS